MDKNKLAQEAYPDKDLSKTKNGTDHSPELRAAFLRGFEASESKTAILIKEQEDKIDFLLKCMVDLKTTLSKIPKFSQSKESELIDAAINYPKISFEINE